jgi:spore germination protein KB
MREPQKITPGQLSLLAFVALFSPMIRSVPRASLAWAGRGAWLCPLVALIPALVAVWLLCWGCREAGSLGGLLMAGYGTALGRVLCVAESVWLLAELSVCIRLYGERFLGSVYRDTSILLFILTLAALAFWQSRKSLPAVMRLARVGFFPLIIMVAVILLLALGQVREGNWLPVAWSDGGGVLAGAVPLLSVFGLGLSGYFLSGAVRTGKDAGPLRWTVFYYIVAAAMGAVVLGVFGTGLVSRLQVPLFSLAKEVSLGSVLQRMEAVVVALWVVSDLLLTILLQRALCRVLAEGIGVQEERELALPVLVAAVFGSLLCGSREEQVLRFAEGLLASVRLIMIYGVPLGACFAYFCRVRKKMKKLGKGG